MRRDFNALVRRLETVERRVDDLRAIALNLLQDSMARARQKSLPPTDADIKKAATMKRLLRGSK